MAIDYDAFMALREEGKSFSYTERDTMLYALASGMGRDPLDEKELPFVFEGKGLVAMPSQAVVVARSALPRTLPLDWTKVLHGEQSLTLHRPFPAAAELTTETRLTRIIDKGKGKGALIYHETRASTVEDGAPLFTVGASLFARGDGGFGGPSISAPPVHQIPDRAPDIVFTSKTRRDQALLYRLTGDLNPLHADPAVATAAGLSAPILHGLCTYAVACRAVLVAVCDYDTTRIETFNLRFTSPVFPGDRIETDIWVDGDIISFRCRVPERDVTVINNGRCSLFATKARQEGLPQFAEVAS